MRKFLADLGHNLSAGFRVAMLLRTSKLHFRFAPLQFVGVAVVAAIAASFVDLTIQSDGAQFNAAGLSGLVRDAALVLLLSLVVASWLRIPGILLALPIVYFSAGWFPDLVFATVIAIVKAAGFSGRWYVTLLWWGILAWSLVVAWRAVAVVLQGEGRFGVMKRAVAVALLFGGTLAIALVFPSPRLWEEASAAEKTDPQLAKLPKVESEEVLAAQPRLLFEALTGLDERESGTTNMYFVGFAGDASQDVFRNDMEAAQDVADERLNTEGKSVVLINSPRTVLETPLATVTNLRAALSTVGQLIDADEDIVLVYLSSHGLQDHRLYVNFPPLALQQVTPVALARLFQESGIKWKIVIVSACYSGGYVEPLKDPHTIVITSSRADRTSFGCDNTGEFTYFGQAFFQEALKATDSVLDAFEVARAAIARREKREGLTPSEPQLFAGDEIRKKIGNKPKPTTVASR